MSDIHWFEFDGAETQGRVGVEPYGYGLQIYLGDDKHSIGLVDLFYVAQGQNVFGFPPHAQLVDAHLCVRRSAAGRLDGTGLLRRQGLHRGGAEVSQTIIREKL